MVKESNFWFDLHSCVLIKFAKFLTPLIMSLIITAISSAEKAIVPIIDEDNVMLADEQIKEISGGHTTNLAVNV